MGIKKQGCGWPGTGQRRYPGCGDQKKPANAGIAVAAGELEIPLLLSPVVLSGNGAVGRPAGVVAESRFHK